MFQNLLKIGMLVWGEADSETSTKRSLRRKLFKTCCMNWGEVNPVHAYYNGSCTSKDNEDPSWNTSFKTKRTHKTTSALEALWKTLFNSGGLIRILEDIRYALFTPDSPQDDPIIVTDESKEEEDDKEGTYDTSHDMSEDTLVPPPPSLKSAQIQELIAQARPSYPDVNQLTNLLVTSLKPKLSKLLASHNFVSCLPTELKELPSKFTELSGEIKDLKQHVKDMEIELPGT
ncbi:hypothetical protein Tco_1392419 [Tanacetum coccineum]